MKVTVTKEWYITEYHTKIHIYTEFGIPTSNNSRDMFQTLLVKKQGHMSRSRSQLQETGSQHFAIPRCIHTSTLESLLRKVQAIVSGQDYSGS